MNKNSYLLLLLFFCLQGNGQNTVGVLEYTSEEKYSPGYNLIYPHLQSDVFLLNSCGQIVHQWEGPEGYRNHNTAYVLENGDLVRTLRRDDGFAFIWEVSGETLVECRSWDNELKWSFPLLNESSRLHHDVEPTPYGTVFLISWDHYSVEEAITQGRDSDLFTQPAFSPDKIIEYDPVLDSIIWEWRAWDHLIQDRDPAMPNYGIVKDNPGRININWENNAGLADWMHVNSIDYNTELDQIMINVPTFNEIWIIDHSTTTEEAKTSEGGNSGMGGDLLWRWGNPQVYDRGDETDQKLFFQHDALWSQDFLNSDAEDLGSISIFNNQKEFGHSHIGMIRPVFDSVDYRYELRTDSTYFPNDFYYEWSHPDPNVIYSPGQSSVQVLPNGNKLICSGRNGTAVELTEEEEIIWKYKTPYFNGIRIEQGRELNPGNNTTFRLRRYPEDYVAFEDKELEPIEYLELDPDETFCDRLLFTVDHPLSDVKTIVVENRLLQVNLDIGASINAHIYNLMGQRIKKSALTSGDNQIDISNLPAGYYLLQIENSHSHTFIKY